MGNQSKMMKKLEKYFEQQYDLALKNLRLSQSVFSEKTVHELRVSIKRIRALFGFITQLLPDSSASIQHYFKPFKKIFRAAGALRDAQVQERLLTRCAKEWNLPAPTAYLQHTQQKQQQAFVQLQQTAQAINLEKWANKAKPLRKILHNLSATDLPVATEKILRYKFMEVRALVQDITQEEPLHEARKIVKTIYYILHLVFKPDSPQRYQDLKKLEETIGDWHDIAVLSDSMCAYLTSPTEDEQAFLQNLKTQKQVLQSQIPELVKQELRCWKIFGNLK